jgi:hypothetical protein
MEEWELAESTVSAFEAVQERLGNLGIAVQSYLYRTSTASMPRSIC